MSVEKELAELVQKCVRCGSCRQVCPVLRETNEEPSVSRGKISLVRLLLENSKKPDKKTQSILKQCTTCLRCMQVCAAGVEYEKIALLARQWAVENTGLTLVEKSVLRALNEQKLLDIAGAFSRLSFLLMKDSKSPGHMTSRWKVPFLKKRAVIPKLRDFKFNRADRIYTPEGEAKGTLLFFPGCMFSRAYVETAKNLLNVLLRLSYRVIVPKDLTCCGAPALHAGDRKSFEKLKERNLKVFNNFSYDAVVTGCATCCHNLKENYGLNVRVYQFMELLEENLNELSKWKPPKKLKVTWHHPCHMIRGQKIDPELPKRIFEALGFEYLQMKEADNCCGMGGSFKLLHPEISTKIQLRKAKNADSTKADVILTECPGCMLNIAEGLENIDSKIPVMHTADVLALCE